MRASLDTCHNPVATRSASHPSDLRTDSATRGSGRDGFAAASYVVKEERVAVSTGGGRFEVYRDFAGQYRWRLWSSLERLEADSARSYATPEAAAAAAELARIEAEHACPADTGVAE